MINSIPTYEIPSTNGNISYYVADGVDGSFENSIFNGINSVKNFSEKSKNAVSKLENIIVLNNSNSYIPEIFAKTKAKLDKYASDAYGFVSKQDKAIVINKQNHQRKDVSLEGDVTCQAQDTISHEIGHLIDEEYSTSEKFQRAYLKDLENIEEKLSNNEEKVGNRNLKEMLEYLKHYMEGADFSDGIDEKDITREGLRENFAECFSTLVDKNPSEINSIYASLFPNTMKETLNFVI